MTSTRGRCGWEDTDESTRPHEHPACKSSGPCLTKLHTSKPQCQTTTRHKIGTRRRRRWPHMTQPSSPPLNLHRVWKLSCPTMPIAAPRSRRTMLSSSEIETRYADLETHHEELGIFLALAEFTDPPLEYLAGRAATSNGRLGTGTQAGLRGGRRDWRKQTQTLLYSLKMKTDCVLPNIPDNPLCCHCFLSFSISSSVLPPPVYPPLSLSLGVSQTESLSFTRTM